MVENKSKKAEQNCEMDINEEEEKKIEELRRKRQELLQRIEMENSHTDK